MAALDAAAVDPWQTIAALRRDLDQRTTERDEALAQQAATSEILGVIARSPTDTRPVFEAIVARAAALCEAEFSAVTRLEDGLLHLIAVHSLSPQETAAFHSLFPRAPGRNFVMGRAFVDAQPVHFEDVLAESDYDPRTLEVLQSVAGYRSFLAVPVFQEGRPIGVVGCGRRAVKPYTAAQIEVLKTFADQAAIALENVRLFGELEIRNRDLGEALEQQTATAEVLQVINSSPGELQPVFEAILEKAHKLCGVSHGSLQLYDGEQFRAVAVHGLSGALADRLGQGYVPGPNYPLWGLIEGERFVHTPDLAEIDDPIARSIVELGGARTLLWVALRRDNKLLGLIANARLEVRPFSEKEISLLEGFAAQAVIAMENARLLTETREALDQQTAVSEVLKIISRSTFDLQPVLDTLAKTAARLCDAGYGAIYRRDGEVYRIATTIAFSREATEAARKFQAFMEQHPLTPDRGSITGRVALEHRAVHVVDTACDPEYKLDEATTLGNLHTQLGVPMLRDGEPIGVIALARQRVEPFSERQIDLARTFADQAVIAIENTRLLTELRESLEQQQAMAELLQVINSSPGDLVPVFEAILDKAHTLCGATLGSLFLFDGELFRAAAVHGYPEDLAERLRHGVILSATPQLLDDNIRWVHNPDLTKVDTPTARGVSGRGGVRTNLMLPLRKDGRLLGAVSCNRQEVRPFSDKEIALLQNFAAQAVIAMDNARLLNEIRQRQAELRVTFDNMGDGVAMFDGELRLAAWNLNFQRILDLPNDILTNRPSYADYIRILAERGEFGADNIEAELSRRLEDTDQEVRLERSRPDGRVIEVRRNPVPGGGFVVIYGDITERKRAEAEIRTARDTAEAALRELKAAQANLIHAEKMASLGQLTAGIAHEIKNPLNFVNNFAGLSVELLDELKETAGPAMAALAEDERADVDKLVEMLTGNLEKIAEHGRRADGIVKSMLAHSRGASGDRQAVDLNSLVDEALNLAYHGARAQDQNFNIALERDLGRNIGPIELVPQDVMRVFLNVFGNGFYAANKRCAEMNDPKFKPSLKIVTRDLGGAVEVRVRDNGIGIPSELRDKLFQPFFTTKPTGEGTGLGLSISYDIVTQQHGGTIEVDSEVGQFTEFTIRLPRRETMAAEGIPR